MQIEKLIDAAIDLRDAVLKADKNIENAKLKAREQGIISITGEGKTNEHFQIYDEKDFKEMIRTREYKIEEFNYPPYKYQYIVKVYGLNFMHIVTELLNEGDERLIVDEVGR
jgi:uncharacterized protein YbcI